MNIFCHRNSNSMENYLKCNSIVRYHTWVLPLCWVIHMCRHLTPFFDSSRIEHNLLGGTFSHPPTIFLFSNLSRIRSFGPKSHFCLDLLGSNFQWPVAHTHQFSQMSYPPGIISLQNFAHATTAQLSCHMHIAITTTGIRGGGIFHQIWITMENRSWNGPHHWLFPVAAWMLPHIIYGRETV